MALPQEHIWRDCLQVAARTDVGMRRANNQDSMTVVLASSQEAFDRRGHLFVVADGMGAHAAGELASKIATDAISLGYQKLKDLSPAEALQQSIRDANTQIHDRGQASEDFHGMGTTVSALAVLPEGAIVAQVGDSRVYRLRSERIEQLTFDHSLVWELRASSQFAGGKVPDFIPKNVITRSLGPNPEVQIDLEGPFAIQAGDVFLLCSDGLSGQFTDSEIGQILGSLPAQEAVDALVDLANLRGGPDNITVIVVHVTGPQQAHEENNNQAPPRRQRRALSWPRIFGWTFAGMALAGAAVLTWQRLFLPALGCTVLALLTGLLASLREHVHGSRLQFRRLGRGPYATADCAPGIDLIRSLQGVILDLRKAAENEDWEITWPPFEELVKKGETALGEGRYSDAVAHFSRAVSYVIKQLKRQRHRMERPPY